MTDWPAMIKNVDGVLSVATELLKSDKTTPPQKATLQKRIDGLLDIRIDFMRQRDKKPLTSAPERIESRP